MGNKVDSTDSTEHNINSYFAVSEGQTGHSANW